MISIIVPIYNVEKYLEHCIESVLNLTYRDFELILVDDGSTDNSGTICDRYASHDNRIRVFHKANGGVSSARNMGLGQARGEYITFVDGDDFIHPQMLEVLHNALTSGDYDLSIVSLRRVPLDEIHSFQFETVTTSKLQAVDIEKDEYEVRVSNDSDGMFTSPCCKLFKKELLEDLYFKPVPSEDAEWNVRLALRVKKAALVHQHLYYYVQSENSLTRSLGGMNSVIVERLLTHLDCLDEIPAERNNFRAMWIHALYRRMLYTRYRALGTSKLAAVMNNCNVIFKKTRREFLMGKTSLLDKVKNVAYYYFPALYRMVVDCSEHRAAKRIND